MVGWKGKDTLKLSLYSTGRQLFRGEELSSRVRKNCSVGRCKVCLFFFFWHKEARLFQACTDCASCQASWEIFVFTYFILFLIQSHKFRLFFWVKQLFCGKNFFLEPVHIVASLRQGRERGSEKSVVAIRHNLFSVGGEVKIDGYVQ